jgi:hypothetical protein
MLFILCIFLHSIFQTNKMHYLKYNKTDHKTHFILGVNFYMFWHQGAIIREFINSIRVVCPKRTSGADCRHFRDKN